ncbi:MAG: lipoprotein NlpI [Planctomycetes bacterium ADurb.Bin126]|nr:MAG: lipoprotein NlpI [Planctomycetes bacterium ADurb.Bin126]HOD81937.1 tetratricopeptide repeat protein [Phycisphaerae bacterium]HQL74152.1 tetratricopeptide repeat protein [Phycisphaerae bacterium]
MNRFHRLLIRPWFCLALVLAAGGVCVGLWRLVPISGPHAVFIYILGMGGLWVFWRRARVWQAYEWHQQAAVEFDRRNFQACVALCDGVLGMRLDGVTGYASETRAMALYRMGQYEQAEREYDRAILHVHSSRLHGCYAARGLCRAYLKRWAGALTDLQQAVAHGDTSSRTAVLLAEVARALGPLEAGEPRWPPDNGGPTQAKVGGDKHPAVLVEQALARHLLGQEADAVQAASRALQLQEDSDAALSIRARVRMKLGEYAAAADDCSRVLALAPNDVDCLYIRGCALAREGRFERALTDFDALLACDPHNGPGFQHRAWCLRELKQDQRALADLESALAAGEDNAELRLQRACLLLELGGRARAAVRDCDRAIGWEPSCADAFALRGRAWASLRKLKKALSDIDRAIRLDPGNAQHFATRAWLLCEAGRHEEAWGDLESATALGDDSADLHARRGFVLAERKDYEAAMREYTRAIELDPTLAVAYCNRSDALLELGRHAEALADAEKAVELEPGHWMNYSNRACAHAALGHREQALADAEKVRSLGGTIEPRLQGLLDELAAP